MTYIYNIRIINNVTYVYYVSNYVTYVTFDRGQLPSLLTILVDSSNVRAVKKCKECKMSQVTITEAAKLAGVSRATIYNDIDSGTLSYETGPKEKKMINVAELQRVYKTLKSPDTISVSKDDEKRQERQNTSNGGVGDQFAVLQERLEAQKKQTEHLTELLKKEQEERQRERQASKQFEEYFKEQLANQSENIKNFTRLLEDQRNTKPDDTQSDLKQSVLELKKELERQKEETREKEEAKRAAIIRRQELIDRQKLEANAEINKSFFKKLFG